MAVDYWDGWTMELEPVKCGKNGCRSCPHGPYWYGYRREGKRTVKKYFGKIHPRDRRENPKPPPPPPPPRPAKRKAHKFDAINSPRTASEALAKEILGIDPSVKPTKSMVKHLRIKLAAKNHPDRGGNVVVMGWINSACDFLLSQLR